MVWIRSYIIMKTYGDIGKIRLLHIKVIVNDNEVIYEGMAESAPEEIKQMEYSKIELGATTTLFVYN